VAKADRRGPAPLVKAAGGVVRRDDGAIAVVHRPRYDDWSLPKGKLAGEEGWSEAALREVLEETGVRAEIVGAPRTAAYMVGELPKLVLYFPMRAGAREREPMEHEVDLVEWLAPHLAEARLSYRTEVAVLRAALARPPWGGG
jgi:8-oxo-dGTP diphosphatase